MPNLASPAMQVAAAALGVVVWLVVWFLAGRMGRLTPPADGG